MPSRLRLPGLVLLGAALAFGSIADARAQALEKLNVLIFSPPSLGAFMPPIIKAQKLDQANGLDITFHERTPDAYTAQFNSGEFKVGGSASLQTIALARHPRRQGEVPVQPVRLLGRGRHLASGDQDAQGPRGQADRRRARDHQLRDVRIPRQEARRRRLQVPGGEHGAARPHQLRARRPRRRDPDLGADLHAAHGQEADRPHARHRHRKDLAGVRGRQPHSLSRRRRACGLGRPESGARRQALRDLQGRGRMDPEEPGGGRAAHRPAVHAGRSEGDGIADSQQRTARHQPGAAKRRAQGNRGRLQGRDRRRLLPGAAVGRVDLRQAARSAILR